MVVLGGSPVQLAPGPSFISLPPVGGFRPRLDFFFLGTRHSPGSQGLCPGIQVGPGADAEWTQAARVAAFLAGSKALPSPLSRNVWSE